MGDGRALQAGTSHNLGQNFAKAFGIQFQGRDKTLQHAWTTSWGVSTRLIGGVIMTHGDDSGLILPPRVAPYQVVIVPISAGTGRKPCCRSAREIRDRLRSQGVRVFLDDRDTNTPGWKFAEWEMRGVPAAARDRAEGHREVVGGAGAARHAREAVRADGGPRGEACSAMLDAIQAGLLARARAFREERTTVGRRLRGVQAADGRPAGLRDRALVRQRGVRGADQVGDAGDDPEHSLRLARADRRLPQVRPSPAVATAWFAKAYRARRTSAGWCAADAPHHGVAARQTPSRDAIPANTSRSCSFSHSSCVRAQAPATGSRHDASPREPSAASMLTVSPAGSRSRVSRGRRGQPGCRVRRGPDGPGPVRPASRPGVLRGGMLEIPEPLDGAMQHWQRQIGRVAGDGLLHFGSRGTAAGVLRPRRERPGVPLDRRRARGCSLRCVGPASRATVAAVRQARRRGDRPGLPAPARGAPRVASRQTPP